MLRARLPGTPESFFPEMFFMLVAAEKFYGIHAYPDIADQSMVIEADVGAGQSGTALQLIPEPVGFGR